MSAASTALARGGVIVALLALWQGASAMGYITTRLLPSPVAIAQAFAHGVASGDLLRHAAVTFGRVVAGFAIGAALGVAIAACFARFATLRRLVEPTFLFFYPVPKIALFPLFAFVFGFGSGSKIAFTAVECLYPVAVTSYLGMRAIDARLVWTAVNFGAGRWTQFRRVLLPAALPSIMAGFRVALPIAIIIVVLTEMIGDSMGLGYYITIWSTRFRFGDVYAGVLAIGLMGLACDAALGAVARRVAPWRAEAA